MGFYWPFSYSEKGKNPLLLGVEEKNRYNQLVRSRATHTMFLQCKIKENQKKGYIKTSWEWPWTVSTIWSVSQRTTYCTGNQNEHCLYFYKSPWKESSPDKQKLMGIRKCFEKEEKKRNKASFRSRGGEPEVGSDDKRSVFDCCNKLDGKLVHVDKELMRTENETPAVTSLSTQSDEQKINNNSETRAGTKNQM